MRILLLLTLILFAAPLKAQEPSTAFRSTEYPLPRFVSTGSNEIYVRTGPGQKYPVKWVYKKKALPVEIILEYDTWRKIRDYDGEEGWVHESLLSGRRAGFTIGKENTAGYKKPNKDSRIIVYFAPHALLRIQKCKIEMCLVTSNGYKGWIEKSSIWGIYESEEFD